MQFKESLIQISDHVQLQLCTQFFANRILVQVRWNGELDTSYSVTCNDITMVLDTPLSNDGEEDGDDSGFYADPLSNYQITTLFGDSNNLELPIIASQISELLIKNKAHCPNSGSFIIMLSSKIFAAHQDSKFDILLNILSSLKENIILS